MRTKTHNERGFYESPEVLAIAQATPSEVICTSQSKEAEATSASYDVSQEEYIW